MTTLLAKYDHPGINTHFATSLPDRIIKEMRETEVPWSQIGYVVYKRTYARHLDEDDDNSPKEEFYQTLTRCLRGMLHIGLAISPKELEVLAGYLIQLKCSFSGRALWQLGTRTVERTGGDSLMNCYYIAVNDPIKPFCFTFEMMMLGSGVGFSIRPEHVYSLPTVKYNPIIERVASMDCDFIVPDNREGWVDLLRRVLEAFFFTGKDLRYNTDCIRPRGQRIRSFGGVASGSEELVIGINEIVNIISKRVGNKLNPIDCLDIQNILAMITVSGNVRRCIPETTILHSSRGLVSIGSIRVGDRVQTPLGMRKVKNVFKQGKQKLVAINLSNKQWFECTPNHKIAVLGDSEGAIDWIEASKLLEGDVVLYNHVPLESGEKNVEWLRYWFYGEFAGDGNCYLTKHRGAVTFACSSDPAQVGISDRIYEYIESIGYHASESNTGANGHHIHIYDKDFTRHMIQYRVPKQAPIVPDFVYEADAIGRAAYLAGVSDADGTPKKYNLCSSKYVTFLEELQILAASLGIVTRIDTRPDRVLEATGKTYANENMLIIMGHESKLLACSLLNPYMIRPLPILSGVRMKNDLSIPRELAAQSYEYKHAERHTSRNDRVLHKNLKEFDPFWTAVAPLKVLDVIDLDNEEETYDIEVELLPGDNPALGHCFFAEGLLVHNSAQIAIGSGNDRQFLLSKTWGNSIIPRWRSNSNNTVRESTLLELPDTYWANYEGGIGECFGLFNNELAENYGRTIDPIKPGLNSPDCGFNPCCVSSTTWVHTDKGPKQVNQLIGSKFVAVVNGKEYPSTDAGFFSSGEKELFRVTTKEGYTFECTADHRIARYEKDNPRGRMRPLSQLYPGNRIMLNDHRGYSWAGQGNWDEGWLMGELLGDGSFHRESKNGKDTCMLQFFGDSKHEMRDIAAEILRRTVRTDYRTGNGADKAHDDVQIRNTALAYLAQEYGLTTVKLLNHQIEQKSSDFYRGFLRGWFDADGSVFCSKRAGKGSVFTLVLYSSIPENLVIAQRMLLRLGIRSRNERVRPEGYREIQQSSGKWVTCWANESRRLVLQQSNVDEFNNLIGFSEPAKQAKLDKILITRKRICKEPFHATIKSIDSIRVEEVYDCTIPGISRFDANGFLVHNCEIVLDPFDNCNLSDAFLPNLENMVEFQTATGLMLKVQKTISMLPCIYPETNAIVQKNHRLGIGVTGCLAAPHLHKADVYDGVYRYLKEIDKEYSRLIGTTESISLTTVKPSGTLSKLPKGCPPGINPAFSRFQLLRIQFSSNSPMLKTLIEKGYDTEPRLNIDGSRDYNTTIASFPITYPEGTPDESISAIEQLENVAFMQRFWADNAVSATVQYRPEELPEIKAWLFEHYRDNLKAISFCLHSGHNFRQAPNEALTEAEYLAYSNRVEPLIDGDFGSDGPIDGIECGPGGCPVR